MLTAYRMWRLRRWTRRITVSPYGDQLADLAQEVAEHLRTLAADLERRNNLRHALQAADMAADIDDWAHQ